MPWSPIKAPCTTRAAPHSIGSRSTGSHARPRVGVRWTGTGLALHVGVAARYSSPYGLAVAGARLRKFHPIVGIRQLLCWSGAGG